jgi:hypothetical protein
MKEAWDEHIQPVLDSYRWEDSSSIADPFLKSYRQFTRQEKIEIEDTLVRCAFDVSKNERAKKALTIVEALHTSQLATGGLARLMRDELRKQIDTLDIHQDITKDYVFAYSTFGLTEAIPSIRILVSMLDEALKSVEKDESEASYRALLRVICLSLRRLRDEKVEECVAILVKHDLRMNCLTTSELHSLSPESIVNAWDDLGPDTLRGITGIYQRLQADQRSKALSLLGGTIGDIDFDSDRARQEAMDLVDGLRSADEPEFASKPEERMSSIRRKGSSESAINGFVMSLIALGFTVGLLVLLYLRWPEAGQPLYMPVKLIIYGVLAILVCMSVGFISAVSTLKELGTFRANKIAFVLAELTLGVCALAFVGLGVFAYLMLQFDW